MAADFSGDKVVQRVGNIDQVVYFICDVVLFDGNKFFTQKIPFGGN